MLTRRNLLLGSGALLTMGGALAPSRGLAASSIAVPSDIGHERLITISSAKTTSDVVAMTFDDGPHPKQTPALLDILKARNVRATFYVIGRNAARYPDILKRMVDEGHEIGNHTWRHPILAKLGQASILSEIDRTSDAVYKAVQRMPVTLRPPYGLLTRSQRQMVATERDLPTILWSVDPEDWQRPGSDVVASRIVQATRPGSIVISHDIQAQTVRAMPSTLDTLADRGFDFATVSMILGHRDWSKLRWRLPREARANG